MIEYPVALMRLALALGCGAVIGIEREWRQKHAGLKTMSLVALGAAAFSLMSDTFGPDNHNPGQIAAAVVGGIGFIGAGVIMHRGLSVQGVTTAATLWSAASVGVAAGLGQYPIAVTLTAAITFVQFLMRGFEMRLHRGLRRDTTTRFEVRIDCDAEGLHRVYEELQRFAETNGVTPLRRGTQRYPEHLSVRMVYRATMKELDLASLEERLASTEGVRRVETRHLGQEDD
ncbi:MAG TPA: MgtC/SapB family protein [Thermoanaerobaculia bacterium]